jgi:hypothetical protein
MLKVAYEDLLKKGIILSNITYMHIELPKKEGKQGTKVYKIGAVLLDFTATQPFIHIL